MSIISTTVLKEIRAVGQSSGVLNFWHYQRSPAGSQCSVE